MTIEKLLYIWGVINKSACLLWHSALCICAIRENKDLQFLDEYHALGVMQSSEQQAGGGTYSNFCNSELENKAPSDLFMPFLLQAIPPTLSLWVLPKSVPFYGFTIFSLVLKETRPREVKLSPQVSWMPILKWGCPWCLSPGIWSFC